MGDLSKNFSRSEFKCKCNECDFDVVDAELIKVLQEFHEQFERGWGSRIKIKINSGCRCDDYNHAVGGSKNSQHLEGKAADIVVFYQNIIDGEWRKIDPLNVFLTLKHNHKGKYGIGQYTTFTHLDVRAEVARW